jgi:pimeloyl-ACP methyl ester carboxylesterase
VHPARLGDNALRELNRQMGREVGVAGYCNQQAANIARPDSRPGLAAIRCPTLVLVGDADQLTPPDRAQEIASGIAGARLVTVPGCGHLSTLEEPAAVNAALLALLEG